MEICPICGVQKHGQVFKTDRDKASNTTSSPDFVQTRICRYAKSKGCINVNSRVDTALAYKDFGCTAEQWLGVAKELTEAHKVRTQIEGALMSTSMQNLDVAVADR
jgi:hypothetical protein